jgi:hypothetical protein
MSPDEELMYRMTESLALRGNTKVIPLEADLATGLLPSGFPPGAAFATRVGREPGSFYAQYLPLQPLLTVPLVWLAKGIEGSVAERFASVMWPGMTMQYLSTLPHEEWSRAVFRRGLLVMLFGPLVSALSAVLLARLGRLITGNRRAGLYAALLWALGTMAWPHARTYFTEPLAALLALAALDQLARWYLKPSGPATLKHATLAGLFLGLANWTRVDAPFLTAGLVVGMACLALWKYLREETWARGDNRSLFTEVFATGALATSFWLLLQLYNRARFGFDLSSGYGDQSEGVKFTTPILIGLHGLLMSPGKGLFFFSPALILGLWGWMRAPEHYRWLAWLTFLGFFPFFVAMATWQNWDGGWCWGPRHVVQIHLPIMLGAVFLFLQRQSLVQKFLVTALFLIGVAVQIYGSSQSPLEFYREYFNTFRDLEYHRVNIRDQQAMAIQRDFVFAYREEDGTASPDIEPGLFPAPMIDSLYLPQHTQWASYHRMWQFGYCDWYFWNAAFGSRNPDRWETQQ